jgi:type VI protein secretion system component VasF
MEQKDDQQRLLTEIRDILREQLEEYRRVTSQSLEYQQRAVLRQEQFGRLYKFALVGVALLVAAAVWYLSRFPIGQ